MNTTIKQNGLLRNMISVFSMLLVWVLFSSFTFIENEEKTNRSFTITDDKTKFCDPQIESKEDKKIVKWTVQEDLTSLYVIERSTDGYVFKMVGYTPASKLQKEEISYEFVDKSPNDQEPYYRITKINKDKTVYFSTIAK